MHILTTSFLLSFFLMTSPVLEGVEIKSTVSLDQTRVYVDIIMPSSADVSFSLSDESGKLKQHWEAQVLSTGRHNIALPLPLIAQGKYRLLIQVGEKTYQQLVYLD